MNPEGSTLNSSYFSSLTDDINSCSSCAQLQAITNRAMTSLNAYTSALNTQISGLQALQGLLTAPTSPNAAVTWISSFISDYLTPQLAAYEKAAAQLASLQSSMSTLTSAIAAKAATFTGCSVSIP